MRQLQQAHLAGTKGRMMAVCRVCVGCAVGRSVFGADQAQRQQRVPHGMNLPVAPPWLGNVELEPYVPPKTHSVPHPDSNRHLLTLTGALVRMGSAAASGAAHPSLISAFPALTLGSGRLALLEQRSGQLPGMRAATFSVRLGAVILPSGAISAFRAATWKIFCRYISILR